jgi:predicted SAM-dependent methyltransferase/glycosyltransferase involved in cell wall biosynthesis
MVDVVVFGTGSNGERAWRAASTREDINVVCFADNDPGKRGAKLHDRAILGPDQLANEQYDFIVLASMYAADIERQLHGLGFPSTSIVAPDPNEFSRTFETLPARKLAAQPIRLDDDTTVLARELPQVLIVSAATLNQHDDASLPAQALFQAFPADNLLNVSRAHGDHTSIARELKARAFQPGVVVAIVRSAEDLEWLETVLAYLPPGVPVIQYCLDGNPADIAAWQPRLFGDVGRPSDLWAAGPALALAIERYSGRAVTDVWPWFWDAQPLPLRRLPSIDSRWRIVMLGSVPDPSMLSTIRRVWRRCLDVMPALSPIEWYVHAADVQTAIDAGAELGEEIAWRGSYSGERLQERLATADLAIVPAPLDDNRAAWVLPSRLAELCGAGLPVFAMTGCDTALAVMIETGDCGIVASDRDVAAMAGRLLNLLNDRELCRELGANARILAEQELISGPAQTRALSRMVRLARAFTPPAEWSGPRKEGLVRLAGSENAASARLEDVLTDRIHYACGRNVLPGWLNVDGYDESFPSGEVPAEIAGRIFRLDLTGCHPFPDNYFRLGYSEDFIEHIDQADFISFLCECFRTFQPGGVLRLSSPGLEGILRRHLRGSDWQAANVLREEAYTRWWHKHFLSLTEVDAIAKHIGWREVRVAPYGESTVSDLQQDTRPQQADLNLIVELVK